MRIKVFPFNQQNGHLTQLWFLVYITVAQQSTTCFDHHHDHLQAVFFKDVNVTDMYAHVRIEI